MKRASESQSSERSTVPVPVERVSSISAAAVSTSPPGRAPRTVSTRSPTGDLPVLPAQAARPAPHVAAAAFLSTSAHVSATASARDLPLPLPLSLAAQARRARIDRARAASVRSLCSRRQSSLQRALFLAPSARPTRVRRARGVRRRRVLRPPPQGHRPPRVRRAAPGERGQSRSAYSSLLPAPFLSASPPSPAER